MSAAHAGSCLCGAVRFAIDGVFDGFYLCHCLHCRKGTGSAHAANLFAAHATLTWRTGREHVTAFRLPGTRHVRSFCARCGSGLPHQDAGEAGLVVPAGCLDTAVPIRPTAHLYVARRANWDRALETVPAFPGAPP